MKKYRISCHIMYADRSHFGHVMKTHNTFVTQLCPPFLWTKTRKHQQPTSLLSVSHSCGHVKRDLLGCNAVWFGTSKPTFRKKVSPPCTLVSCRYHVCFTLRHPKMEPTHSSETSVDLRRITHDVTNQEYCTLQEEYCSPLCNAV
jgi:hypothetical protein